MMMMINELVECIREIKTYQNCIVSCFIAVLKEEKKWTPDFSLLPSIGPVRAV